MSIYDRRVNSIRRRPSLAVGSLLRGQPCARRNRDVNFVQGAQCRLSYRIVGVSRPTDLPVPLAFVDAKLLVPSFRLDPEAEADMASMQAVINLGRFARDKRNISLKTPVKGITVVCKDEATLKALEKLQLYVKGELNAWEVS